MSCTGKKARSAPHRPGLPRQSNRRRWWTGLLRTRSAELVTKDGPFRFWFNRDFQGSNGSYNEGRELANGRRATGSADARRRIIQRSTRRRSRDRASNPKFRSPTPNGKYVFEFASCRSTWIMHTDAVKPDLKLNIIGEQPKGCLIAYIPEHAMEPGRLDTVTARSRMARKTGSN